MSRWARTLLQLLFGWLFRREKKRALNNLQAQGISAYLKVLQGVRLSAIGLVSALVVLQFLSFGALLMIGAGVFLSPWPLETKLWTVFYAGCGLFALPILGLAVIFSDRLWYRISGAKKMVEQVLENQS